MGLEGVLEGALLFFFWHISKIKIDLQRRSFLDTQFDADWSTLSRDSEGLVDESHAPVLYLAGRKARLVVVGLAG
jgi:hypothetical protein